MKRAEREISHFQVLALQQKVANRDIEGMKAALKQAEGDIAEGRDTILELQLTQKQLQNHLEEHAQCLVTLEGQRPMSIPSHLEKVDGRLGQLEKSFEELAKQTTALKCHAQELEMQLQASLASTHNGSFLWKIPEVARRKRDAIEERITSIYSPPFYTGR